MDFCNDCSHLPLRQIASDPNLSIHERTEKLDQLIISIVDKHAPEKKSSALQEKQMANTRNTTSHHPQKQIL